MHAYRLQICSHVNVLLDECSSCVHDFVGAMGVVMLLNLYPYILAVEMIASLPQVLCCEYVKIHLLVFYSSLISVDMPYSILSCLGYKLL